MKRTLNLRFLAALLVVSAGIAVGVHLLHGYQERRQAGALLVRADEAEATGRPEDSVASLVQYLDLRPDDAGARARLGLLLDRSAKTDADRVRALHVLEQAIAQAPDRHDVRRRLVLLATRTGFDSETDPTAHLQVLLRHFPEDAELDAAYARRLAAAGRFGEAAEWFGKAVRHDPREVGNYRRLAELLRDRLNRPGDAAKTCEALEHAVTTPEAALVASRFWLQTGNTERAEAAVRRARELDPNGAEVLLASADLAARAGHPDEARRFLDRGLAKHPETAGLYLLLARIDDAPDRRAATIRRLEHGLALTARDDGHGGRADNPDILWTLTDLRLANGDTDIADGLLPRLRQSDCPASLIAFQEARVALARGDTAGAVKRLDGLPGQLGGVPRLVRDAWYMLGQCYERQGDPHRQIESLRKAVAADPLWPLGRFSLATALAADGQSEAALEAYRQLAPWAPAARIPLARLLLAQTLRQPAKKRRWAAVEDAVTEAARVAPGHPDVPLLRAELYAATDRTDAAAEVLREARRAHPDAADPWLGLADLEFRRAGADAAGRAARVLDEARSALGDRVELRIARALLLNRTPADDRTKAGRELNHLSDGSEAFDAEKRVRLFRGLAAVAERLGDPASGVRFLSRVRGLRPDDLAARGDTVRLALRADDRATAERALDEIRAITGTETNVWRVGRIRLAVWRAERGDKTGLAEADTLSAAVLKDAPGRAAGLLLRARVDDLLDRTADSLARLKQAVDLGEREPAVLRALVERLTRAGRLADADQVLRTLSDEAATAGGLARLTAEASLRGNDPARAVALAQQAVPAGSKEYRDHVWLGQLLTAAGDLKPAEAAFRRAVALAPGVVPPHVALVGFLARAGRSAEAQALLDETAGRFKAPDDALALAYGHELLKRPDQARRSYETALAGRPEDPAVLRSAVGFYLRDNDLPAAKIWLRRLSRLGTTAPADAAWARRTLAVVLSSGEDPSAAREALSLVEPGAGAEVSAEATQELRARALVLARRTERSRRRQAVDLFEEVARRQDLSPDDRVMLARLYESLDDWRSARVHLLGLLGAAGDRPAVIAYLLRCLIKHKEPREAREWLARLEAVQPDRFRTDELAARLLSLEGKPADAEARVRRVVKDHPERLAAAAALLEELGLQPAAEAMFRDLAGTPGKPENVLLLANYLGRHGRTAEALGVCEKAWASCPPAAVASACLGVLFDADDPGPAEEKRVEKLLADGIAADPSSARLRANLASLRGLQGRYDDATALYRQILADEPGNALALNNLAYLLAFAGGHAEALDLLRRAEDAVGAKAELLDTRAVVHLAMNQPEAAIRDLDTVIGDAPNGAAYLHLARAYALLGRRTEAIAATAKARQMSVRPGHLYSLERPTYEKLLAELEASGRK